LEPAALIPAQGMISSTPLGKRSRCAVTV
jgi:hypothetical protein